MKLFQIEEPEGGPADPDAPGAAIGIDASSAAAEVAISVGGNAVVLIDREGFEQMLAVPELDAAADRWEELFAGARLRAERSLARPVTHAVIVLAAAPDSAPAARLTEAAEQAGLTVLRLAAAAELPSGTMAGNDRRDPRRGSGAATGAGRRTGRGFQVMPKMIFIERDGGRREVDAPLGLSVLEIAHRHGIDIEGACEGSLACSTCHVIVDPEWYDLLKEASEDEEDMLDLAFNLDKTSRLGCQIIITEELDGLTVRLPAATRNLLLG